MTRIVSKDRWYHAQRLIRKWEEGDDKEDIAVAGRPWSAWNRPSAALAETRWPFPRDPPISHLKIA